MSRRRKDDAWIWAIPQAMGLLLALGLINPAFRQTVAAIVSFLPWLLVLVVVAVLGLVVYRLALRGSASNASFATNVFVSAPEVHSAITTTIQPRETGAWELESVGGFAFLIVFGLAGLALALIELGTSPLVLIALSGSKKSVLLRALKCLDEMGGESEAPPPRLKAETIERMLGSAVAQDRVIAIQLVPMSEATEEYKYSSLFEIVRHSKERSEVVAALMALRGIGEATALFTQGDLKAIARWMESGTLDVRIAAAKLLGSFGADLVAVEALLSRDFSALDVDDYCASVEAMANARVLKDKVAEFFFSQLAYYLDEKRKKTVNTVQQAKSLLNALKRLRKIAPAALVSKVSALVTDFRIEDDVKYYALLCYPAIAMPSSRTVDTIKNWFLHPPLGKDLDAALVQVPSILARQCRESVDYVMACVGALVDLRRAMVDYHKQIAKRDLSDESEFNVTELRRGIDEVTKIIVAFDEFIQNGNGGKKDALSEPQQAAK